MKVLFIGGTGAISRACTELAVEQGIELWHLNRGQRDWKAPKAVKNLKADIRKPGELAAALKGKTFDAVVDWICFTRDQAKLDIEVFAGKTGQYIFISSASAYEKPPSHYIITESTPLKNPFWEYSRNKIACEELLTLAWRDQDFPITIVRPSYTYYTGVTPTAIGGWDYTMVDRIRKKKPVLVHGDGSSLWVMTHNSDFAKGFVPLLGHPRALGEAFHITSDEVLTWNQIYGAMAAAAGEEPRLVHIPSEFIAKMDADRGASLLGDKAWSTVFDNSKIKRLAPGFVATKAFHTGMRESVAAMDADKALRTISAEANDKMDRILDAYRKATPS